MRYFDFIKEIKEISTSHILVNEYGEGDIYEYLNNGEHKYPCIFLTVTNLTTTDSGTAINFTLFYTDRLVENQANKTSIQSTGISVIKQILSKYEQLHPEYLLNNVNYTPFTEKFTDMCAGVFCDVAIENQIDTLEDYDNECEEGAFAVKTITLTKNGVYDIVGYDSAVVLVETEDVKLESITITENGVYVPEEGGYNEVIVDVAGCNVKKLKVANIQIDNSCLDNNTWYGYDDLYNNIDRTYLNSFELMFHSSSDLLRYLDVSNWDVSNILNMRYMFFGCSNIHTLDVSNWDVSNVTHMGYMFYGCKSIGRLDLTDWFSWNLENISYFADDSSIEDYVGGRTIDEVVTKHIKIFDGLRTNAYYVLSDNANRASLRALINGLVKLSYSTAILQLTDTQKSKLTDEDIIYATNKGWTIA